MFNLKFLVVAFAVLAASSTFAKSPSPVKTIPVGSWGAERGKGEVNLFVEANSARLLVNCTTYNFDKALEVDKKGNLIPQMASSHQSWPIVSIPNAGMITGKLSGKKLTVQLSVKDGGASTGDFTPLKPYKLELGRQGDIRMCLESAGH